MDWNQVKNRNRFQFRTGYLYQVLFALALSTCYHPKPASSNSNTDSDSSTDFDTTSLSTSSENSSSDAYSGTDSGTGPGPFYDCGNNSLEEGEVCDDGKDNGSYGFCNIDCSAFGPRCGDGEVQESEECDDGNLENFDGCDDQCKSSCGNGVVEALAGEECDHGTNNADHLECTSTCKLNVCGDELLFDGVEECDQGANNADTNECTSICTLNVCGDSFVLAGMEECDDGNSSAKDGCENDCTQTLKGIVLGCYHTCALFADGNTRCWGWNQSGQLGDGNPSNNRGDEPGEMPPPDVDVEIGGSITQLVAGYAHSCILMHFGEVRCWGNGTSGQLGYDNTDNVGDDVNDKMPPEKVELGEGSIKELAAGYRHNCALFDSGKVRCWGAGAFGTLGSGSIQDIGTGQIPMPPPDVPIEEKVIHIASGSHHNCALLESGKIRCWGANGYGQLGYDNVDSELCIENNQLICANHSNCCIGDEAGEMSLLKDVNVEDSVVQLAAGNDHTCAILASGNVRCWGRGKFGQLGYDHHQDVGDGNVLMPPPDVNIGGTVIQLVAGYDHTCALLSSGQVKCWGKGTSGQLGYGNKQNIGDGSVLMPPDDVELGDTAVQLTAKAHSTCALLSSGQVRCWGWNNYGQLGYGHIEPVGDNKNPINSVGVVPVF